MTNMHPVDVKKVMAHPFPEDVRSPSGFVVSVIRKVEGEAGRPPGYRWDGKSWSDRQGAAAAAADAVAAARAAVVVVAVAVRGTGVQADGDIAAEGAAAQAVDVDATTAATTAVTVTMDEIAMGAGTGTATMDEAVLVDAIALTAARRPRRSKCSTAGIFPDGSLNATMLSSPVPHPFHP
eukprot:CAMPEP_0170603188 /NCGR_PEP_ID=MMETSP0224-20130122/18782_1 /TAXON_ID=285029 /ORGANISM="Togula jolla, Strain CCCM 725" /LENGTH=179 /DNA_ID=CAMNT_0010928059 /DNA_START=160 /DNA_END=696 /DNA_ORIENTATION=+